MKILSHLSGGFDSVAACIKLLEQGHEVKGLFFDLGQEYLKQELSATVYASDFFIDKYPNWLGIEFAKAPMELSRAADGSPTAYIPVRNFVFAAHSANIALAGGFEAVAVGSKTIAVRPEDPYSFADCSIDFYNKVESLVDFCSEGGDSVKFIMPLVTWKSYKTYHVWESVTMPDSGYQPSPLSKGEVMQIIIGAGMDLSKLWSCYEDGDQPCGKCYHCIEVKKAFDTIDFDYTDYFVV